MACLRIVSLFAPAVLAAQWLFACASSEPVAQSPEGSPPAAPERADTEPATPVASATDDAWEGEAEAKDKNASAAAAGTPADGSVETRTNEVIAKVIRDNRKPFRDCFEKTAKELPELEGTMTIHFVLDPEGKVKNAELNGARSTIQSGAVVSCSIDVLKGLKFPPSSRGMESVVNYPFDFKR
jgi:outer membrane biosynthesis protein TonB